MEMRLQDFRHLAKRDAALRRREEVVIAIFGETLGMSTDSLTKRMGKKLAAEAEAQERQLARERALDQAQLVLEKRGAILLIDRLLAAKDDDAGDIVRQRRNGVAFRGTCPLEAIALARKPERGAVVLVVPVVRHENDGHRSRLPPRRRSLAQFGTGGEVLNCNSGCEIYPCWKQ